jgi:hypothetical protein
VLFCRAVGSRPGGMLEGVGWRGSNGVPHSRGTSCSIDKGDMLVSVARRTFGWIRGIKWSLVRGNWRWKKGHSPLKISARLGTTKSTE